MAFLRKFVEQDNTGANVGAGEGVFAQKNALDLEFKSLLGGYATALTSDADEITISSKIAVTTLTDAATIAVNAALGPNYEVTLAGNRTLGNPTNSVDGQELVIAVKQDATGSRTLAFDTDFVSVDGGATINSAANSVSLLYAVARDFGGTLKWYYTVSHAGEAFGESNTASNVGTGLGWWKTKSGVDLVFKSALAGYGVALSSGTDENTIALKTAVTTLTDGATIAVDAAVGPHYMVTLAGNRTLSNPTNSAVGQVLEIMVAQDGTGGRTLAFDTDFITVDNTVTVDSTASAVSYVRAVARNFGGGVKWYYTVAHAAETGSGEANTASNVGTGAGVFKAKSGVDLQFKSLLEGYGLVITGNTNDVTVASKIAVTTLTDGASVAVDADTGPNFMLTVAGDRTLANPTNSTAGKVIIVAVAQDGTGGRTLAFGADWINVGRVYQIAQTAAAVSMIVAQARDFGGGVKWYYAISHSELLYTISPAQIAATQNDYAPTNFSAANNLRINSDASRSITGFTASATQKRKRLINVGSFNIIIEHQDAGSSAANRVICPGGDVTLNPDDTVEIEYDDTTARWRIV